MKLIDESHIHAGITSQWLESLPASEEFKIQVLESNFEGLDHCVTTSADSDIYWAKRGPRGNFSRMVHGVSPVVTNKIVTIEVPHEGSIVLATAYFGRVVADMEPFQPEWSVEECQEWVQANPESFWAAHALVHEE